MKKWFCVMLRGEVWYSHITEEKANFECTRARQLGYGMAYVEKEG